jgi:hypothetical protein
MSDRQRQSQPTDRDLVIGFVTIAVALIALAVVAGVAARLFLWVAGFV